ncbi:MAG: OAM dimerization domain-containing protein [Bacillota bacterium]
MNKDLTAVKPYGDTLNDGKVQVSFTLPVPPGPEGKEAARIMAGQMNLKEVEVVHSKDLGEGFSFYIAYGKTEATVDYTDIQVARATTSVMDYYEVNEFIEKKIGRKVTVVGACTGSDAHTVGLDAIMNMKGYSGEYGLERYPWFETYNLGSQVPNEELIQQALKHEADAILVSQVVTQKNVHVQNLTELVELLEAENLRDEFILVVGGPRISHELALELGFDAGFGSGTIPPEVASFLAEEMVRTLHKEGE